MNGLERGTDFEVNTPYADGLKVYLVGGRRVAQAFDGPIDEWTPDYKIFVYDLPGEFHSELKEDQKRCINDQYGTEIRIHENLLKVQHASHNKDPRLSLIPTSFAFQVTRELITMLQDNQRITVLCARWSAETQCGRWERMSFWQHSIRTLNPEEAEFFFVPIYPECYLFRENHRAGKDALKNTNRWFRKVCAVPSIGLHP